MIDVCYVPRVTIFSEVYTCAPIVLFTIFNVSGWGKKKECVMLTDKETYRKSTIYFLT